MFSKLLLFLTDNGERPPLRKTFEQINSDLQFAYQYVGQRALGKSIFDYGCGGGYGTEYLSRFTNKSVKGFDIDANSIISANQYFIGHQNLSFYNQIPHDQKFDIIVSFQVIEHLTPTELKTYFKNIKSLLSPKGQVFIATPNKNITSYKLKTPIFAHHVREYNPAEFSGILQKHFSKVTVYGQIDINTHAKVVNNEFSYDNLSTLSFKNKLIRLLSRSKIIRYLTSITPQELKNLLLRQTGRMTTKQLLVTTPKLIDNSYILIADCSTV